MGFPEGAQTTVLTMKLGLTDGSADRETVTITPSPSQIVSTALNDIREGDPILLTPDRASGTASVRLLNTDASGYNPTGWTYEIRRGNRAPYNISLPASLGPTADLADLTAVSESPGVYDVLLPASELGAAAFLDVGQTEGTVAAGDDDRFTGGGGGGPAASSTVAASSTFGQSSTAGVATTYSRGDHVHGTPALPAASSSTAGVVRLDGTATDIQPLGTRAAGSVGQAADAGHVHAMPRLDQAGVPTADVAMGGHKLTGLASGVSAQDAAAFGQIPTAGTGSSNYTAGNDSRLSDSRTPSGAAGGDLGGTFPNPTVNKVAGATVSGTPATGKVLTATSGSAASWQTPAGGGGAGVSIVSQGDDRIDLEIVTLTNTAVWAVVRTSGGVAIGKSVKAAAGDRVLVSPSFMYAGTQYELDLAVMASDGSSISRYAGSSGSGTTPGNEGYAPLYTQATSFPHITGPIMVTVAAGEVDGSGRFTVNLAYHAPSLSGTDQHIYAGSGYIARWLMLNIGPEPA
ncbi:hypothetical protein V2S66_31355 [Streptomyces sp. V4-01]|uniref:Tail fiber protein n=1 Tax=Actinacidiphila polyblastidii TaxID=3110430 RepID=A0ABU7PKU3_9ACTN|nr:hypothetical protein [Streptomyces sp. V4-01]